MPDLTLQSVSQDVDESNANLKEENSEDHKETESTTELKEEKETDKPETPQASVFCNFCLVNLTSKGQADIHFNGLRHKKAVALVIEHKFKASQLTDDEGSRTVTPPVGDQNDEPKKSKRIDFLCEICLVKLTSTSQIEIHFGGKKHKKAVEALKEHPRSLDELAADQECSLENLKDEDLVNNVCVVKPTARDPNDPLGEESNHIEALAENAASLKKATKKKKRSNAASENAVKDAVESGEKQTEEAPSQKQARRSKKPKGEEIFCNICSVKLTSKVQADMHNEGTKHKTALAIASGLLKPANPVVRNQNTTDTARQNFRQYAYRNTGAQRMGYLGPPRMKPAKDMECICRICVVRLTSTLQAVMHYEGKQHKRAAEVAAATCQQSLGEGNKKELLVCEVCHVILSSQVVADAHYAGSRHSKKVQLFQSKCGNGNAGEAPRNGTQPSAPVPVISEEPSQATESCSTSSTGVLSDEQRGAVAGNLFSCDVCNVKVNSLHQMEEHYQGTRHKYRTNASAPRMMFKNKPPVRSRLFNGGIFPGHFGPWAGPVPTFRSRPPVQYNSGML